MKLIIAIVLFFLIGAFFIIAEKEIKLNSRENIAQFFNLYGQWISMLTKNFKTTSGYIVKMEWLPDVG